MIRLERPPNYDAIVAVFPKAANRGVLFAYGDHVYNPSNVSIPKWIIAHEYKHCARQFLTSPETWWEGYLTDQEFRYHEELLAHAAEFQEAKDMAVRDRNVYARLFDRTAHRLIAPLYNYQPPKKLRDALKDLEQLV